MYYGLGKGSPDLVGWRQTGSGLYTIAQFLGVEVKMPGKMKAHPETLENQDRWRDMIEAAGGIYVRVTSVEEAVRLVRG